MRLGILVLPLAINLAQTARAADLYWNGGDTSANPANGGTGNWNAANAWRTGGSSGAQATWLADTGGSDNAYLGGSAGTVTLGTGTDKDFIGNNLEISTSGYTITSSSGSRDLVFSGTLTLAGNVALTLDMNNTNPTWGFGTISFANGSSLILKGKATADNSNRLNLSTAGTISGGNITLEGTASGPTGLVSTANGVILNTNILNNSTSSATMLGATSGSTFTYGGVLSGSSHLQISAGQSGGAGVVTLTNQNTYLGDTWLNTATDGVLRMGATNALPAGTTVRFSQSAGGGSTAGGNGTLDLGGQATSVGALQGGGRGVANTAGAATLTIGKASGTDTFSGVIGIPSDLGNLTGANNQISLVKTGGSTQILTGANTYSGGTTVSGGTLQIGAGGTLGGSSGPLLINGGILDLGNTTQTVGSASITSGTVQNGILNFGSLGIAGNSTVSIGLTGNGNLNITGGTVNLLSAETFSGLTNVNGGVVQLSSNLPGGLTMGAGTLNVTNTSFTVGSMTITGGTSTFAGSVAAGSVNISGNSSTSFAGNVTASGAVSISGGTVQTNGNSISGSTVTQSGGSVTGGGSVTATSAYIFDNSGAASSSASYGGPAAVNLTGGGNTTLSGNNTYTGTTSISNGSTLTAGSNTAVSPNSAISFGGSGNTLDLAGNSAFIISLTGGSGNVITSTGGTASIQQGSFDGTIQGGLGVTTTGAVTLGGANTYTGATQVNGGSLSVSGSLGNSEVTVASGARLGGTGAIGGGSASVVIQSGGTYSPGNSPGAQTIQGSLEFQSGSIFEWDLNASTEDPGEGVVNSGTFDQVTVNGTVSGPAVFQIVLGTNGFSSPFWDTEKKWTDIFSGSGAPANLTAIFPTFGGAVAADGKVAGQGQFSFNNSGTLTWTAVPELSNILIGGLMGLGMIRRGRRA